MENKNVISITDFERIFFTIYDFIGRYHFPNPHKNCSFFSVIGAAILNMSHGIKATSVSGAAAFDFGLGKHLVFSCGVSDNVLRCSDNGFHSWVEADGWLIDFTSPLLPEVASDAGLKCQHRKMLQLPLSVEAESPFKLSKDHRFYLSANNEFTKKRIDFILDNPLYERMVNECIESYISGKMPHDKTIRISGAW